MTIENDILSPLLWSLIANEFLKKLKEKASRLITYITGKFLVIFSSVIDNALSVSYTCTLMGDVKLYLEEKVKKVNTVTYVSKKTPDAKPHTSNQRLYIPT